jgi:hypothetical protein
MNYIGKRRRLGPQGPIGATGPQGIPGAIGATGPAGAQGPIGVTGMTGPAGAQGPTGATGLTGPAGAQGPAGEQGPIGATGAAGVQGPTGATGSVGPTGPAGPAGGTGFRQGLAFNPAIQATTTITSGTKSYWFIVLLNEDVQISGFSCYTSSGADQFRIGIYRGFLKSAVSGSITLVGQSAAGSPVNYNGLSYTRRTITAEAGQTLQFYSGEYMTIGFHSNGSTNVFVASPTLGSGLTELSYTSTANYALSGFPSSLTQSSILGTNVNKPCFELY